MREYIVSETKQGAYRTFEEALKVARLEKDSLGDKEAIRFVVDADGETEIITTGEDWNVKESCIRFSEIYDGEIYDATFRSKEWKKAEVFAGPSYTLIPQQGEHVTEQEQITIANILTTPEGDVVVDFGQEITGYVELTVEADAGEVVDISFAEVLDKYGNFYNENYRSAKCQYRYVCKEGRQTWKPHFTFYGFRYIRINEFPGGKEKVTTDSFRAIVLQSNMKRTGYISSSNVLLNRLFENCIWGQKGNFLEVPTDCPQRDERLGWTGDAQVFAKNVYWRFILA